jgi:hypothetical protein
MRANEFITEETLDEINWRKAAATGAFALGALGSMAGAHAGDDSRRVTPTADGGTTQSVAQQMAANPDFKPSAAKPGGVMPNQDVQQVDNVTQDASGNYVLTVDGKQYNAEVMPKDFPMVPRGAKKAKVLAGQMGERGINNYTVYLMPSGRAFIMSGQ